MPEIETILPAVRALKGVHLYHADMSNCQVRNEYLLPKEKGTHSMEPSAFPDQFELSGPVVDVGRIQIVKDIKAMIPDQPIHDSLQSVYRIPEGVKRDAYVRYRIITSVFNEVSRFFPDISKFARSIVTGYLCIPFGVIDSEGRHDETERTQSHHEYVGKTVRNVLNSKSF